MTYYAFCTIKSSISRKSRFYFVIKISIFTVEKNNRRAYNILVVYMMRHKNISSARQFQTSGRISILFLKLGGKINYVYSFKRQKELSVF